jgi:hypothetical protein
MVRILQLICLLVALLSCALFAWSWLGPVRGEGWGAGWANVIAIWGAAAGGAISGLIALTVRLLARGGEGWTGPAAIALGLLPVAGLLAMMLGLIHL